MIFCLVLHESDFVNLAYLLAWLSLELDAYLLLVLQQFSGDGICLVLDFRDTLLARIIHRRHNHIVDKDIELVTLPLANTPIL